jgi:hypothetical protein
MHKDLTNKGTKVQFTILNGANYASSVHNQTKRCDFPVWQDTKSVDAWGQLKGGKEYWYVYNKKGELNSWYLPYGAKGLSVAGGANSPGYKQLKALVEKLQ